MPGLSGRLAPLPITFLIGPNKGTTQLTADKTVPIWRAPFACEVVDAGFFVPTTKLAKSATNYYDMKVFNGGTDGTGTSNIASKSLKSTTVAALAVQTLTMGGTPAWRKLDAGDYLVVKFDAFATVTQYEIFGSVGVIFGNED